MYTCSICNVEVDVDHVSPPKYNCNCVGNTIHTGVGGKLKGVGGVSVVEDVKNNNLSDEGATVLKNTSFVLIALEVFRNKKDSIFAKDVTIKDSISGKEFTLSFEIQPK